VISKLLIHATALDFRGNASLKSSINLCLRKRKPVKVREIARDPVRKSFHFHLKFDLK